MKHSFLGGLVGGGRWDMKPGGQASGFGNLFGRDGMVQLKLIGIMPGNFIPLRGA
jgi:hypothetical protein